MRVAIFVTNAPGNYGGGRLAAYVLAQCLARAGADVAFVTNHVPVFHEDLHAFGRPGRIGIHVTKDFLTALPEGRFDVVVLIPTQSLDRMVYVGARGFAQRRGARMCIFNFETPNWFNAAVPVPRDEVLWREWKLATEDVAENGVLILSNSRESEKYARLWYDDERLEFGHWHQPINLDAAARAAVQYREKRILSFVRPRDPHKGAGDLIDVLCEEMRGWTLSLIVGSPKLDEAYRDALVPVARRYGVEVEVHPLASDTQKFVELRRARMLLYPSWFEGYGLPPIEALTVGTPCVCYDLDVVKEVCGDALITAPVGDVAKLREGVLRVMKSSPEDWAHLPQVVEAVSSVERCGQAALAELERFLARPLPPKPQLSTPAKLPKRPEPKRLNLGAAVMHPGWLLEIKGWAAAPPDARVVLRADGELLGEAVRGMVRKDVLKENPWIGTEECGFGLVRPHVAMGHAVQVSAVVLSASGEVLDHATRVYDLVELAKARPAKPPSWWRSGGMKFLREAGSSLVHGWAAGAPVPFLLEGFAGPRRVWIQGGRARPDVMGKLEGFPQQTPGFSAHLGPEESWMLEAAGAFTLVGYSRAGVAVQALPAKWEKAAPGAVEPHLAQGEDPTSLPVLAELKRVALDEYGVLEVEGHVLSRPRMEAIRVLLDGELLGETLPDRLQTGLHNKNRAYGDAYSGFALNGRAPNLPGEEVRVEFIRGGEVAHAIATAPTRMRRGKGARYGADLAWLPPGLLEDAGSGVTLVVIEKGTTLDHLRGAAERALLAELRRRGPLLLLLHGNPHGFTPDLSRWQELCDGLLLVNDLHPGEDALAHSLALLAAEPGLGRVIMRGAKRRSAIPDGLRTTTLLPGAELGAFRAGRLGFGMQPGPGVIGLDGPGLLRALALPGMAPPEGLGEGPWLLLDATLAEAAVLRDALSRLATPLRKAGLSLLCVVDAPPLEPTESLRARLGLPRDLPVAWAASALLLAPATVRAVVDLAPAVGVAPFCGAMAARGVPVLALAGASATGSPWPLVTPKELASGMLPVPVLPGDPYAALEAIEPARAVRDEAESLPLSTAEAA
ncbi:glycosyltransferase family 4 protein [Roseomonas mucosa]